MRLQIVVRALVVVMMGSTFSFAQQPPTKILSPGAQKAATNGQLPLSFEANRGQADPKVSFISRNKGYTAVLTGAGMILSLRSNLSPDINLAGATPAGTVSTKSQNTLVEFRLVGSGSSRATGEDLRPGKVNYFIGNNPSMWHTGVPTYARVRYKSVYPGIDLVYYGNQRQLEYDFAVLPGADPNQIQFEILGANSIELDGQGALILHVSGAELHFQAPVVYQESAGARTPVEGAYTFKGPNHIGFHISSYDPSKPLVIDPVLVYSTLLGGSGDDEASGIGVDNAGNIYLAGFTDSTDFPLATLGLLPGGNAHVFVAKLDPSGSNLIYADYIGGNSQDYGYAIAIDSANEVYVTGSTASSDFPLVHPFQPIYPGSFNAFLTKISSDGSALLYSTYLGGNGSDTPSGIAIDSLSEVLIAGNTTSTNFPVANAFQTTIAPNQGGVYGNYGFLTKFSSDGSSLVYSTYLSGNSNVPYNCGTPCWPAPFNSINGVALDGSGNAYVAGSTNTYNFPVTPGAYLTNDSTQLNGNVGFVSKFGATGALDYSTYFYGSSGIFTSVDAIAVDSTGSAYITGAAFSDGTFPITSTSICDPSVYGFACGFGFVTKFDPTGSTLQYSTFLGPNNNANPRAITLDATNNAYVLSSTSSNSFVTVNGIESYSNGSDLLLVEIDPLASSQLMATYLGGSADEFPAGLALDATGSIYIAGSTDSSDYPVTPSAFQLLPGGNTDAFVLKIGPTAAPAVSLSPTSLVYAAQAVGSSSQPETVLLRNMGSSALTVSAISASGDFAETDNCVNSVPAAGNCTVSIIFTPTASGARVGALSIQDGAAGSPHSVNLSGIGSGPGATLTPTSLTFAAQPVGTSSAAQPVVLANTGNATLNISAIQITGDFTQINNCPSTLAATSTCTVNVTFAPTASGSRSGTLSITDNAPGSPQNGTLNGTGAIATAPIATLAPSSVAFVAQAVGTTSAAHAVTLSNTGNAPLSIRAIQTTGDYAQTNNCPAQLAAASSCTINNSFSPKSAGARNGTLTVSDNAPGSPHIATLSGTGSDFTLASAPVSNTVNAGATATYLVSLSPVGGAFSNPVGLSCSGLPAHATCSFSPQSVTPGTSGASSTMTVATSTSSARSNPLLFPHASPVYLAWVNFQGFGFVGMVMMTFRKRARRLLAPLILWLLIMVTLLMSGCAGGTGIAHQNSSGTTYTLTVSATAGTLQHSLPLTLTVK